MIFFHVLFLINFFFNLYKIKVFFVERNNENIVNFITWAKNANIICDGVGIFTTENDQLTLKTLSDNINEFFLQVPENTILSLEYGKTTPLK